MLENNEVTEEVTQPTEEQFDVDSFVDSIIQLNSDLEQSFKEDTEKTFVKMIVQRLLNFGLKLVESDNWIIMFCMNKAINHIKNSANISVIPNELYEIIVDRICGEFLFNKHKSNQLTLDNFDFDMAVKQLQEGDTTIQFAINEGSETDEQKLTSLINYLITYGEGDLICYRKLKW